MATLYDLAMQYLNQSLPKTFKYDRTPPIGTNPPGLFPQPPVKPIEKLLPRPGGNEEGFSVYNPDPNRTRNESNYNERPYKSTVYNDAFPMMGDPMANQATGALNADGLMSYAGDKPLEGIPGAIANYAKNSIPGQLIGNVVGGINNLLPVNRRAIYENELLGQGIMLDDIGRIVSDGGNINTAENIMAGYNANKVTAETFQKRRDMIDAKMSDKVNPKTGKTFKQEKLDALDAAEAMMLGTAKTRADTIFDAKSLEKDPSYVSFDNQLDINNMINTEKEEDENFNPLDPKNKSSIYTATAPTYLDNYPTNITGSGDGTGSGGSYDEAGIDYGDGTGSGGSYDEAGIDYGDGTGSGGSYDEAGIDYGDGTGSGGSYDEAGVNYNAGSGYGSGNDSSSNSRDKIVCTMMNESYGFGSFRNKIWMKFHKDLSPEYQKGYHKLFLPLVRIAKTNKVVKKILEHIAVHSTIDMRQATRGKMHLLGRIYRKILLPLCYFVGKHGKSSN